MATLAGDLLVGRTYVLHPLLERVPLGGKVWRPRNLDKHFNLSVFTNVCQFSPELKVLVCRGNHSSTQIPDLAEASVGARKICNAIKDQDWLDQGVINIIRHRSASIIQACLVALDMPL